MVVPLSAGSKRTSARQRSGGGQKKRTSAAENAGTAASKAVVEGLIEKIQRHMDAEHWRQVDVFRMMDTDGSGTLSAVELHRALAQMRGDAPTRSEVDALLRAVDENGNGTVSIDEFFNYFRHARRMSHGSNFVQSAATHVPMGGEAKQPKSHRSTSNKDTQEDALERQLQQATDENYLLQMQLSKLQSTLKKTQSKLDSVQTWRDVSAGSPKSPYEPLFEKQVENLTAQLAATEEKLKHSQQSHLKLRAVQTWQASTTELETEQSAPFSTREAIAMKKRHETALERVRAEAAERERDQAVQDLEDIEGTFGEEDLREYCEVCNHHWHREYVTWFAHPFETEDGRYVNSACGGCFRQVPVGHGPVV